MSMYGTGDFKKGLHILIDKDPYTILEFEHCKPGKGNQFTRTRLRHLITGNQIEKTFKSGKKVGQADVYYQDLNFLYKDDMFHFMEPNTYEQMSVSEDVVGENKMYLLENMKVKACLFNDKIVSIEIPSHVVLKVVSTESQKGSTTAASATKPVVLETGLDIHVPTHINVGDSIKIDTKEGVYVERVQLNS